MKDFFIFQHAALAGSAFLTQQTELAFSDQDSFTDWGLAVGQKAQQMLTDAVGMAFVPQYRFLGSLTKFLIRVIFFLGLFKMILTIVIRAIVFVGLHGLGTWILLLSMAPCTRF